MGEGSVLREWTVGDLAAMTGMFDDPEDLQDSGRVAVRLEAADAGVPVVQRAHADGPQGLHLAITVDGGRPGPTRVSTNRASARPTLS
jgi:hypothetical protein